MDDVIFEVDNKSLTNRPDLWGHYGIAREMATIAGRPLRSVPKKDISIYASLPAVQVDVRDVEHCYRYTGIKVENVSVKKSPMNMRIRLFYCGSRAINFLADLTNYVMLELGQPMHAFDLRRVQDIQVQRFAKPFPFTTLDGVERTVDENTLMICSGDAPVAIAGIMGGLATEIEDDTDSLLLESANFDGVCVRKSTVRLGLRTDASMRYEKVLDPELCRTATERFLYLLFSVDSGAKVISCFTDCYVRRYPEIRLEIDKAYVDRYTGIDISVDEMVRTLTALGFKVAQKEETLEVTVPSWRATKDVTIKADLIEEITRIYGYDNFAVTTSRSPLYPVKAQRGRKDDTLTKDILVEKFALHEVHSYIWCDRTKFRELGMAVEDNPHVRNAQTPDHDTLRNSMIPTLLCFTGENRGYAEEYGMFEIGRVCQGLREDGMCNERKRLGVVLYSRTRSEEEVFFSVRDMAVALGRSLRHTDVDFRREDAVHSFQHPGNTFGLYLGDCRIGSMGTLHPVVKNRLDRKGAAVYLEIDMDILAAVPVQDIRYREPGRFPGIDIDMSFVGPVAEADFALLKKLSAEVCGPLLEGIRVKDVYETPLQSTLTLRLTFQSPERTLSKAELAGPTEAFAAAMEAQGFLRKV